MSTGEVRTSRIRARWPVPAALLAATLVACSGVPTTPEGATCAPSACTVSAQELERQRQQARDDLQRWADAVAAAGGDQGFVIVGDATSQIGAWEEEIGSNNKIALMAGKFVAAVALSDETPPPGDVHWQGGSSKSLPVISAAQALRDLQAAGVQDCPECDGLRVTAAKLTTAPIETSRGMATVPAWEFSLEGTTVHITRVAISSQANVSVTPPVWDPNDPPVGLSIESASTRAGSRQLTVFFGGAPKPGGEPCGADYDAEAVESTTAVVVIIIEHRKVSPEVMICEAVGAGRTATVELGAPLGDRAVLEVMEGLPVPVTLTR